jgi:hypothetical protein
MVFPLAIVDPGETLPEYPKLVIEIVAPLVIEPTV